ncbi:MAG: hypothetical protein IKR39_08820 [Lachnospiraceae bacterium]|nr:hypothetical protein [Lachnospiraceae bacterium]
MEYCFKSDVKPIDLWKIAMLKIYKSYTGIINIVFSAAMMILCARFYGEVGTFLRAVLIFLLILFPILQPLAIYSRSIKQLEGLPGEVIIHFGDKGLTIDCNGQNEQIPWKRVANAYKQFNMVVVMADDRHGYMLTDRVLKDKKDEFFSYLCDKIKETR